MNVLSIVLLILIIGLVVFVHEFGHFLLAKKNGIGVVEFNIGMGPDIYSWKRKGTKYALKWIPFGGACVMLGDDMDIPDTDEIENKAENAFGSKSVWARISTILAGPIFNFILAFLLSLIVIGIAGSDKPVLLSVAEGYPAEEAGLMAGDVIYSIGGERVHLYREVLIYLNMHQGETVEVVVERDGERKTVTLEPKQDETGRWLIGISSGYRYELGVGDTFLYSFYEVKYNITTVIKSLSMIFTGGVTLDDFSGPVGIANTVDDLVTDVNEATEGEPFSEWLLSMFLTMSNFVILISANLGVMNLLPLPALDGGKFLFLLIEAVTGKAVPKKFEGIVHVVGFALLMVFMVIVLFNDIKKIFM